MVKRGFGHRRGLSTVIGAVFMVIITIGALNVVLWTIQQQNKVTEAVIEKSNSNLNKLNEDINISEIGFVNNKLNLTVTNNGGATANLKSIYIVNETASPSQQYRYDIDYVVDGRESVSNIGQTLPLSVKDDTKYSVKLVTETGNTAVTTITSLSSAALQMTLYVIPPTITTGQNVTLLFAVTNNITDSTLAATVSPTISSSLSCSPYPSATCKTTLKIDAENDVSIPKGSTYLFKWIYNVNGPVGTVMTFTASLENGKPGNSVTERGRIQAVSSAQVADTFLFARLIQQPEIEAIFSNPFGQTNTGNQALWGAVIANPTEGIMHVRKLVMTAFSPRANANDKIICNDTPTAVANMPGSGAWSCPTTNTAVWSSGGSPLAIPAHSAKAFLVMMGGATTGNNNDIQSIIVNYNVFTDYGQFTKTGYDTGLKGSNSPHPMVNVFLSKAVADKSTNNMIGVVNVNEGQLVRVNATIANFVAGAGNIKVDAGTKFIIDIPKDFSSVTVTSSTGFSNPCQPTAFSDGSTQISCSLANDLTGNSPNDARTIQFTAYAPTVDSTKMYVLYLLADGTSEAGTFAVGPVGENVIRIIK